jgi:hypothetical protein
MLLVFLPANFGLDLFDDVEDGGRQSTVIISKQQRLAHETQPVG